MIRCSSMSSQCLFGRPTVHQHDAGARGERRGQRDVERRGVVQRTGAEAAFVFARLAAHACVDAVEARRMLDLAAHALRPSGRAGRVQHRRARLRIVDVVTRLRRDRIVVRHETVDVAPDRETDHIGSDPRADLGERVREADVADQRRGLAVVDDVRDLVGGEVPVDGRQPHATARRRPRTPRRTRDGSSTRARSWIRDRLLVHASARTT